MSSALTVHTDLWTRKFHAINGWQKLVYQASDRVVTDFGRDWLIDAMQGLVTITDMKYHEAGVSNVIESVTDTQLFGPVLARAAGTLTENGSSTFRSVGTVSFTTSTAFIITEHGLYTAASGANILDRTVLTVPIPVDINDRIEFTFDLTLASGG